MFLKDWPPPCNSFCTKKYAALTQIPWRVFCKKGCTADGESWEECSGACNEICYKDPVFKDREWSSFIDRSPGHENYSMECFRACVAGCGFKFDIHPEKVEQVKPNRPTKPPAEIKPPPAPPSEPVSPADDLPCTSA